MKKYIMLMLLMGVVLSACNDQSNEENQSEENQSESGETSENIIDESISEYGDTLSYEMNHDYVISTESDEEEEIQMITTYSDQDEMKVDMNTPDGALSHYFLDDGYYIYNDGEFEMQEETPDISDASYGELVSQLEMFKDTPLTDTDDGHVLTQEINSIDEVSELLPEDLLEEISEAEVEGTLMVHFNDESQFDSTNLELSLEEGDESYTLNSTATISYIGEVETIETPEATEEQ